MAKSKAEKYKSHSKLRLETHFGIVLTEELHKNIIQRIQTGENATFVCPLRNKLTVWSLPVPSGKKDGPAEVMVPVVYDKNTKTLRTVLPPQCVEVNEIGPYLATQNILDD